MYPTYYKYHLWLVECHIMNHRRYISLPLTQNSAITFQRGIVSKDVLTEKRRALVTSRLFDRFYHTLLKLERRYHP